MKKSENSFYMYMLICGVCCGPISTGYILGYSSPTLRDLANILTTVQTSTFASLQYIGGIFGSVVVGYIMGRYCRRRSILYSAVPAIVGWLMIIVCDSNNVGIQNYVYLLYLVRILGGISCGMNMACTTVYLYKIVPKAWYDTVVLLNQAGMIIGIFLSHVLGKYLPGDKSALVALAFALGSCLTSFFIPEYQNKDKIYDTKSSTKLFRTKNNKNISPFDDLWPLMSEYTFKVDPDYTNEDLSCIICNKLMIDARQSVCGCRYCYKCINEYLSVGDKFCPGGKTECNEEFLVMERDVLRNMRMNNRISKLRVVCPNVSCQSKIQLTEMREHLRVCTKEFIKCPYTSIGCDNGEESKSKILTHLSNDGLTHTKLLIECVNDLRNEVNGLKDYSDKSKLEMATLREESIMTKTQLSEIRTEIKKLRREVECRRNICGYEENRIVTLEEELREVREEMEVSNGIDWRVKRETKKPTGEIGMGKRTSSDHLRYRSILSGTYNSSTNI